MHQPDRFLAELPPRQVDAEAARNVFTSNHNIVPSGMAAQL
jgi:hypothetical protein